ncbi:hypothetical protein P4O66_015395, partial [Electrophorus voltai]
MHSLIEHYGQPHKLSLRGIAEAMDGPDDCSGDTQEMRRRWFVTDMTRRPFITLQARTVRGKFPPSVCDSPTTQETHARAEIPKGIHP